MRLRTIGIIGIAAAGIAAIVSYVSWTDRQQIMASEQASAERVKCLRDIELMKSHPGSQDHFAVVGACVIAKLITRDEFESAVKAWKN